MKKFFVLFLFAFALAACEDNETGESSFEFEDSSITTLTPGDVNFLEIQSTNGYLHVFGSDTASKIHVEVTRRVKSYRSSINAKDRIEDIQVTFESRPEGFLIVADHPSDDVLDYEIDFDIIAPIIFDYDVLLGNGDITINSVSRNLGITLGNGNVLADVILLDNCTVGVESGNGTISLIIPGITSATLFATVGNGSISTSKLTINDLVTTTNTLSGVLGDGEGNIQLILGNGTVTLEGY
jgi:hypothetical protein